MTAKHHAPHPKRRQKPNDLEKRVRRIERNYMREIVKVATHIARREIKEHLASEHAPRPLVYTDLGHGGVGCVTCAKSGREHCPLHWNGAGLVPLVPRSTIQPCDVSA